MTSYSTEEKKLNEYFMGAETGMGAIILALIGLITKIWMDSSQHTRRITDVVEKNAIAMTNLNQSIKANTRVTEKSADVSKNLSERIENVLNSRHKH